MNAIRADEELDNIHSLYVDQWDWELVLSESERTLDFLKTIVKKFYRCLKRTEFFLYDRYSAIAPTLPEDITFVHSEELLRDYPSLSPRERETQAAKKYGAIFVIGIGAPLADGTLHDGRAPDYDDWITETDCGYKGLNGDIIVWNNVLEQAFELSSMGIRVSPESLKKQLELRGCSERAKLMFHSMLLNGNLPFSAGGGIGQSRLCMYFLRKAHIGEIQVSYWSDAMREKCQKAGIPLL
jgi:aspartate--ammonia ligase